MATSEAQIRQELEQEREKLAEAVETLREEFEEATDVSGKLRAKLPIATAGALATGFVVAGGIGATMRLIFRRSREDDAQVKFRLRR